MVTTDKKKSPVSITPLLITLGLLLLLAIIHRWQILPIPALDKTESEEVFSAGRAYEVLRKINPQQLAHPADSIANRTVEQGITTLLRDMGYQAEIQETQVCDDYDYGVASCLKVRNIIVHIKGSEQNSAILLSAHYDSVPTGPGVSDAGVAVGSLLEIARLLSNQAQPRNSIVLLFNEGEENSLKGAKAFMEQHPLAKQLQLAINIEARGSSGQSILFETGENSGWLVQQYAKTTPAPLSSSLFYEAYKFMPNHTDLTVYKEHGLQGLNFAHAENVAHYHTKLDNVENLNLGSLQHHGDNAWGIIKAIKDNELSQVQTGNRVFTDIFGLFIVQWPERYSIAFSLALIALFIFVYYLRNNISVISIKTLLKSLIGVVVTITLSAVVGYLLQEVVSVIAMSSTPWWSDPLPMRTAIWLGVILAALFVAKAVTKKSSAIDLTFGLLLTWLILSVLTSVVMPGVSYLFILPTFVGLLSFLVVNCFISKTNDLAIAITAVITNVAIGITFVPIVYSLELMLSFESSLVIALFLGFVSASLLPLIAFANANSSVSSQSSKPVITLNKLLLFLTVILIATLFWISRQISFTPLYPQRVNLYYLQKPDNTAFFVANNSKTELPIALNVAMHGGEELQVFPWTRWQAYAQEITSLSVSAAGVTIIKATPTKHKVAGKLSSGRAVQLQLHADNNKLSAIELHISKDSGLISISNGINTVNYHHETNDWRDFYEYQCEGISCADMQLTLNFDNLKKTTVIVAKVTTGLPMALKPIAESRSDIAVPSHDGDLSYVLTEVEL